jgi:cytochrome c oxidase subunit I
MTVTEAPRDVVETAAAETEPSAPTGLAALVGSGDPRAVGQLFVGTSLLFLLVSGVTGVLTGFEQVDTTKFEVVGSDSFLQLYTLHTISGLFLVVLPLLLGLATAVVPLQVGASTLAFPRLSAAGYWVYLVSGGLIVAAYAVNGGPFGGDSEGVALFLAAMVALLVALCAATLSVVTTVIALRAPGMSLRRTPLFSWSMLVGGSVWLLILPVLAGMLVLAYIDYTYGQRFLATGSGDIYPRLRWVFWPPTLFAAAIPALGIIGDIVPVFAQTRHRQHRAALFLIGLFGALSFGAWTQLGVSGAQLESLTPWLDSEVWTVVCTVAVVPLLGLLLLWTATLQAGRPKLFSPLVLAFPAGALLLGGVAAGAASAHTTLDLFDTTWTSGAAYAVLLGTLLAAFAGLVFWAPKLYGALVPEGVGQLVALLFSLGTLVVAVAYGIAGVLDQPTFTTPPDGLDDLDTIELLNLVAAVAGVVVVLAGLLFILGLLRAGLGRSRRRPVADDPWSGNTLEWATSSPPPVGNFAELPEITSEAPVYDARHRATRAQLGTEAAS